MSVSLFFACPPTVTEIVPKSSQNWQACALISSLLPSLPRPLASALSSLTSKDKKLLPPSLPPPLSLCSLALFGTGGLAGMELPVEGGIDETHDVDETADMEEADDMLMESSGTPMDGENMDL